MPVVINEFEVVTEPQMPKPAEGTQPSDAKKPGQMQASTPHDIGQIIRHHRERIARVRAY
jgi:hypothetical protein